MQAAAHKPGPIAGAAVNWRAGRIGDPVARLRFLRHAVGDRRTWDPRTREGRAAWRRHRVGLIAGFLALLILPVGTVRSAGELWQRAPMQKPEPRAGQYANVWLVERQTDHEIYSNGLRVERRYETVNEPRNYVVFPRGQEDNSTAQARTAPAGIVFHTTESQQAEFSPSGTPEVRRLGEALLRFVQREKAYHYLIDRFGVVWRVVRESDTANHAGYSVWADANWTYVNVNRAFLGVSVETRTLAGEGREEATPAQLRSLRVLTEMLRASYHIAEADCITHAQVSVNPDNMQMGYHYDWASHFPFAEIGLPDNYAIASPGVALFGFRYDPSLVAVTGEPYWRGLSAGSDELRQLATAHGAAVADYRAALEKRYRRILALLKANNELSKEKKG